MQPTQLISGTFDGSHWNVATRAPSEALRPFVRALQGYDERAPAPQSQRQFPNPTVTVIIELGPSLEVGLGPDVRVTTRHAGGFVAGITDSFAVTAHQGEQRGIQVDLTPTGARRLFGLPMSELAGRIVGLCDVLPRGHAELVDRLLETEDWIRRLDLVEAFLAARMIPAPIDTRYVDWVVQCIEASHGVVDLADLARQLGYSHKHLIALFRDQVGVRPKLLARLVRFGCVISEVRTGRPRPWIELAAAYGFSDQAHLAREVRHFTGLTPTQTRQSHSELASLLR